MRTVTTKAIALITALLLILGSLPVVSVFAAYENTYTNTGNQAADIVGVAATQVGYLEGSLAGTTAGSNNYQKFGVWYDANVDNIGGTYAAWCAMFVSWCAKEAGIPNSIVYYHAYCPYGVTWFKNQGNFQYSAYRGGSYTPQAGDIIYFQSSSSSVATHVGIVRYASGGYVYTIEGNTSGQNGEVNEGGGVFAKSYSLSYSSILGYGTPDYVDNSGNKIVFESNGGTAVDSQSVKTGSTVSVPTQPTRYGFDFAGWYCNPELTDAYDFGTSVAYGFTLYAKWNEQYWGAMSSLMPVEGSLTTVGYNDAGEGIWPYFGADDGSVTLYSGVNEYAWPSAYMRYENSIDSANDAYIYVKKDGTAQFNAIVTYMDINGTQHDVKLSQIAGNGDTDFGAGYDEFFVNFGQYVYDQGHMTASGNIKILKCTYYVIGEKDTYVKLYDMKFTPAFSIADPYTSLYNVKGSIAPITQSGKQGSYTYDNGVLYMSTEAADGYSVTFDINAPFNPTEMSHLLMDVTSTAPFNITFELTNASSQTVSMEMRNEFFNAFGDLTAAPAALPAGTWQTDMNLSGYFEWNGGKTNSTIVKKVTITLADAGDLSLAALQASRKTTLAYVRDGLKQGDSIQKAIPESLTSSTLTINESRKAITRLDAGSNVSLLLTNLNERDYLQVFDLSGNRITTGILKTGMTVSIMDGTSKVVTYTIVVTGDVTGTGEAGSSDARRIMASLLGNNSPLNAIQTLAADYNGNGVVDTSDAREMLIYSSRG